MLLSNNYIEKVLIEYFKDKPVNRVWLFGSYARNEADESSDIDILVDIDKNAKVGMRYFLWHEELAQLLNKKVDVVSYGWENKYIKPFIDKDKRIIYERAARE